MASASPVAASIACIPVQSSSLSISMRTESSPTPDTWYRDFDHTQKNNTAYPRILYKYCCAKMACFSSKLPLFTEGYLEVIETAKKASCQKAGSLDI